MSDIEIPKPVRLTGSSLGNVARKIWQLLFEVYRQKSDLSNMDNMLIDYEHCVSWSKRLTDINDTTIYKFYWGCNIDNWFTNISECNDTWQYWECETILEVSYSVTEVRCKRVYNEINPE